MPSETAFTMDSSSIKYGPGATREIGDDVGRFGARRVMVVTDPNLGGAEPVMLVLDALRDAQESFRLRQRAVAKFDDLARQQSARTAVREAAATEAADDEQCASRPHLSGFDGN